MKIQRDSSLLRQLADSLRMTDIWVGVEGVVGGTASNHPLFPRNSLNTCHSEPSEESPGFIRIVLIDYT